MKRTPPYVSILLPVYNGEKYLHESIQSILAQQYAAWECIIINDGSTDRTKEIVASFADTRIRYYEQKNQGLGAALNRGIRLARGRYIARQDQDDRAFPQRLVKQATFLDHNPRIVLVGTWAQIWKENAKTDAIHQHPTDSVALKFYLLFDNPFVHSSVMLRKETLDSVGVYTTDPARQPPEDYDLWSRIARSYEVANIGEVLQIYRETSISMSRTGIHPFMKQLIAISTDNLSFLFREKRSRRQLQNYAALFHGAYAYIENDITIKNDMLLMLTQATGLLGGQMETNEQLYSTVQRFHRMLQRNYRTYRYGKFASLLLEKFFTV